MITKPLTDLFEGSGMIITPSSNEKIIDLNYNEIVTLFECYGVLLFRGFGTKKNELINITDIYTDRYSNDAMRRSSRFREKNIRNVDSGIEDHELHSEASYSYAAWPEIIWFFCNQAPQKNGETILCDGQKLWESFSSEVKKYFLSQPISYELEIPFGKIRKDRGKQIWISNTIGTNGFINWETGSFEFKQLVFAVHESRQSDKLCFANHVLAKLNTDPQIKNKFVKTVYGKKVPDHIMDEIKKKSSDLTFNINWQNHDFAMIDNKRFMHGRRKLGKKDPRDIVVIQTKRATFAFGSTTRVKNKANLKLI